MCRLKPKYFRRLSSPMRVLSNAPVSRNIYVNVLLDIFL